MPAFIVDITKRYGEVLYEWGNRYIVNATDLTDAASAGPLIAAAEATWHAEQVQFIQARIATVTANDGVYTTVPLSLVGELVVANVPLPAITTINIKVLCEGLGNPGRKFYHPFVDYTYQNTVVAFQWLATYLSDVKSEVEDMIGTLQDNGTPIIRDLDSAWLTQVSVQKGFGYHQFNKQSPRPPE